MQSVFGVFFFLQSACEGPFFQGALGGGAAQSVDTRPNIPCAGGVGRAEPLRETWQKQTPPFLTVQNYWKHSSVVVWRMFATHVVLVLRAHSRSNSCFYPGTTYKFHKGSTRKHFFIQPFFLEKKKKKRFPGVWFESGKFSLIWCGFLFRGLPIY